VKVDGDVVPREHQLLGVSILKTVNRISAARLVYLDGAAAAGAFPLSDAETFRPGRAVEVLAGSGDRPVRVFTGIVVKQGLKVREQSAPQLLVECRHRAVRMTVGRRGAYYVDRTDAEIIEQLLGDAGLDADVEATSPVHPQQVQYASTDWDFLLTRAEANGRLVLTNGEAVQVRRPAMGRPVATLQYGATVLEMDAELESRQQFDAVRGFRWDPAQQAVLEVDAADPRFDGPGDLPAGAMAAVAGLPFLPLSHASIAEGEAQAWADARWLRSRLNRASGRLKCEGIATVEPGDVVTLGGAGARFDGDVLVTGVRHEMDLVQGWKTHIQFGGVEAWLAEERQVSAPPAGALLPAVSGLQIGVVVSNEDPGGEHRVRVRMPLVSADAEGTWARVATLDAGPERGTFFRPEPGDEVVLGFLGDDPRQAVVLGMLHSSANAAPLQGSDDNHEKLYRSRSGLRLYFNDDTREIRLETPAGNTLALSERESGIRIESAKALTLRSATGLQLDAGTGLAAKGGTELKLEGSAGAEISSGGITTVKGSLVQIN
jgi:Rhs element Vgr protein